MLLGDEQKKVEIYLVGQLWIEEKLTMWTTRARNQGIVRKNVKTSKPKFWIAGKTMRDIWNINVNCDSFNQYLTIWSKVTASYALEICKENINRFPDYDWILCSNKRLKDVDLSEDVMYYNDYEIIYLKIALKGSVKIEKAKKDLTRFELPVMS
jgi:hypothetical protein